MQGFRLPNKEGIERAVKAVVERYKFIKECGVEGHVPGADLSNRPDTSYKSVLCSRCGVPYRVHKTFDEMATDLDGLASPMTI